MSRPKQSSLVKSCIWSSQQGDARSGDAGIGESAPPSFCKGYGAPCGRCPGVQPTYEDVCVVFAGSLLRAMVRHSARCKPVAGESEAPAAGAAGPRFISRTHLTAGGKTCE